MIFPKIFPKISAAVPKSLMKSAWVSLGLLATVVVFAQTTLRAEPYGIAVLQGMDKVTARVSTFLAPVGQTVRFGSLEIIVRQCDKRPPEETPESAAFVDIWEVRPGEAAADLFRGWMFASSPALNALEHPVYDVWVIDCKNPDIKPETTPLPSIPGAEKIPPQG